MCRFLNEFVRIVLACVCLSFFQVFFVSNSHALTEDNQQAIKVAADSSLVNYKSGVTTYEGNVVIDQGTTHLTADKVVTKNNKKHKLSEAIAFGIHKQVDYMTTPKTGDNVLHATAKIIKFYPATFTVVLEGDVLVTQGKNSFNGQLIIYNTKTQVVDVPAKGGRATLIIEPDQLKI